MRRRKLIHVPLWDRTLWIGKFRGFRALVFGREQVLDSTIEVRVQQEGINPPAWTARAYPGANQPICTGLTPEICMETVAAQFVTVVDAWQAYSSETLFGRQKLTPGIVADPKRKVS